MLTRPVESTFPYLVYKALLTQTSTNAPSALVKLNTLGITPTYVYSSAGEYLINLPSAILTETNFGFIQGAGNTNHLVAIRAVYNSPSQLKILTFDIGNVGSGATYSNVANSQVNSILTNQLITIEIYN